MNDADAFARLVEALRPWHSYLVIIGGWAHRLHRLHDRAGSPAHPPLRTTEADVALSVRAPIDGDIGEALAAAGFSKEFFGEDTPPATHYVLGDGHQAFYAEFLAPLAGNGRSRTGERDVTMTKAGVSIQKLRHLDLLLLHPWTLEIDMSAGIPLASAATVQVANPVSFIAQKLLIRPFRPPRKQEHDALYIHDTLELFGSQLEPLRALWQEQIKLAAGAKRAIEVEHMWREQFGSVNDVIRGAVRLQAGRDLGAERMQQACAYGLERIFGA